jgi:hypothetical protein
MGEARLKQKLREDLDRTLMMAKLGHVWFWRSKDLLTGARTGRWWIGSPGEGTDVTGHVELLLARGDVKRDPINDGLTW